MSNTTKDLMKLSKETLVALLETAVAAGNEIDTFLEELPIDMDGIPLADIGRMLAVFLHKSQHRATLNDITCLVVDGMAPKSTEWVGKFKNLNIVPEIDNEDKPEFTEELLLKLLKVQSNLTRDDFKEMGFTESRDFQIFAANGWNLVSYMFNNANGSRRESVLKRLNS